MSTVDIEYEVRSFGQTNGKTYHVRFNCGNLEEQGRKSPESVTKLEEIVLLPMVVIARLNAEEATHGTDT